MNDGQGAPDNVARLGTLAIMLALLAAPPVAETYVAHGSRVRERRGLGHIGLDVHFQRYR